MIQKIYCWKNCCLWNSNSITIFWIFLFFFNLPRKLEKYQIMKTIEDSIENYRWHSWRIIIIIIVITVSAFFWRATNSTFIATAIISNPKISEISIRANKIPIMVFNISFFLRKKQNIISFYNFLIFLRLPYKN